MSAVGMTVIGDVAGTGRGWVQLALPLADVMGFPAATVPVGIRPGECERCGATDGEVIPMSYATSPRDVIEAHHECGTAMGYVPAAPETSA